MLPPALLPTDHRRASLVAAVRKNLGLLLGLAAIPWAIEIFEFIIPGSFDGFGIRPRTLGGLLGIATVPFLHGGFGHLVSNTLPFLVLGGIVLIGGRRIFVTAILVIMGLAGGAIWTLGPANTNHIGASILVFGYLGFLLARGVIERSVFWIVTSLVVLVCYGGMIGGVLPGEVGVSWQGHLFGFVAGILAARILFTRGRIV